ncbi:MAG: hypothetical protein H6863_04015 [Rhodospirillales bacterium]|nr:hypothetical protein [Rhodospirillales bacterium]
MNNQQPSWQDFNGADEQRDFDLIPKGTIVPVRMTIKPGGYDEPHMGWTGGYATRNDNTGAVYLNCEFVITAGQFAKRKVWSLIGLHSPKGPEWANMGRSFVKAILNSARGVDPKDNSPEAQNKRRINGFADLDGIEFLAKIDVGKDARDDDKNEIRAAITPDHKEYQGFSASGGHAMPQNQAPYNPPAQQQSAPASQPSNPNKPSWAQ